jgi:hypothetical protein
MKIELTLSLTNSYCHLTEVGTINFGKSLPPQFIDLSNFKFLEIPDTINLSTVYEVDETEYLLSSDANKKHLMEALERLEKGEKLIKPNQDQFK